MRRHVWILLGCMLSLLHPVTQAQQTIFNVPSADVTPPGKIFLQHESQFRPWEPGSFWLGTHYAAYGIGHGTELDATLFNLSAPASNNIVLGLGAKKTFPVLASRFPREDIKLTLGEMIPVSLEGEGVGNWTYGHLSLRIPKIKTRVSAGVSAGTKQIFGRNTVHFIGGFEQPITRKLSLIGDWYSGTHASGFLITGFSYALPKSVNFYGGYQIPNTDKSGRSGFVIEFSKLF